MAITQNSETTGADVSHKREHMAFIDKHQRARYALDATRDGLWDWDITSGDVYFSPRWARLLGYEPEEIPQRVEFFFSILHPDDVELVKAAVENHLAGLTQVKQDEVRLRTKSGEYQWFYDRGEVVSRDDEGRPLRMVGTITDITDRKQADARLNLQKEVLQRIASGASLHESLTLLVQLLDDEMGDKRCSILLLDRDGKHLRHGAAPNIPEEYCRAVDGLPVSPSSGCCGTAVYRREPVIVEDIATDPLWDDFRDLAVKYGFRACWSKPIMDGAQRVLGTFAVYSAVPGRPSETQRTLIRLATDVAAIAIGKYQSEVALQESKERMQLLIQASNVGLWDWDLVTNQVYFSPEWKAQIGYGDNEFPNSFEEWVACLHPDDREPTLAYVQEFREGRRTNYDVEFRMRHKNGSWRWMFSRGNFSRNSQGQPVRMMGCHVDITERKAAEAARADLEAQLFEAQKLQAIGTLAGGIAHDFNNILASILVNVSLASDDVKEGRDTQGSLDMIMKSSLRARDLVNQILAFSRRETPCLERLPVAPVITDALEMLRSTLPAGVKLESEITKEPLEAMVSPSQLQQVLVNLCTNAWQAIGERGGRITVGMKSIELPLLKALPLGLSQGGSFIHIWVTDTGCGMDAATRARAFEPFFTTKPVGLGTGLGLSAAHGIMVSHHGVISVDSELGRGTTFHLYIPAAMGKSGEIMLEIRSSDLEGQGQHVLYVDDDEMVAVVVERLLSRAGYRATCFTCSMKAIDAIRNEPDSFDMVIADYNMPDLSGLDIARTVAKLNPAMPVVISSGFISDNLQKYAKDAGVKGLLNKQDTFKDLLPMVHKILAGAEVA